MRNHISLSPPHLLVSFLFIFSSFSLHAQSIPPYEKTAGVSDTLNSIGSDTLANMMTLWFESFKTIYPSITFQIQAAGSSTAPPALLENTAELAPMSRAMKDIEIQSFEERFGYAPLEIPVAIDALAVFVHKDNPIDQLTIEEIDAIFSQTLNCGHEEPIKQWGQTGLENSWKNRHIQRFGRNSASGTYGYFKQSALCAGDFLAEINEQPGSSSVVQSVQTTLGGIGYSGIGYMTSGVKALAISDDGGYEFIKPNHQNAASGEYPLARFLYIYINKSPNKPLSPSVREFLLFVLSEEGQEIVEEDGYVAIPPETAAKYRALIAK